MFPSPLTLILTFPHMVCILSFHIANLQTKGCFYLPSPLLWAPHSTNITNSHFWHFWHVLHAFHGLHGKDQEKNLCAQFIWPICFIWALKIGLCTPLKWPKTSKTLKNSHFWHVVHALHGLHDADWEKNLCAQFIWSIWFIWVLKIGLRTPLKWPKT